MTRFPSNPNIKPMPYAEQAMVGKLLTTIRQHCQPDEILLGIPQAEGQRIEWLSAASCGLQSTLGTQNGCLLWLQHLQQRGNQGWARLHQSPLARIHQHCPALAPETSQGGVLLCSLGDSSQPWGVLALFGMLSRIRAWQQDASLHRLIHIGAQPHQPPALPREILATSPEDSPQEIRRHGEWERYPRNTTQNHPAQKILEQRLVGQSPQTHQLRHQIVQASQHRLSVLLLGETGTGKEVVARLLHDLSPQRNGPFIAINCAAIPENLIESELFGFQKGAFSGAIAPQSGLLAQAHGGTLFLDEIGDMPLPMQAKLLRVLESRRYRPLGCSQEQETEFRLIAATHQPLDQQMATRSFRLDLYYRLCQCQLLLTPLRERPDDLLPLCLHFIQQFSQQQPRLLSGIAPELFSRLCRYPFPGNVRELKNLLEIACAHADEGTLLQWHNMPITWQQRLQIPQEGEESYPHIHDLRLALRCFEADVIRARLDFYQGNRSLTAASLGLPKRTLDHKCQKLELR